ncbi:MAG: hypothetical protein JNJ60_14805, partial [Rhodocyclaceae bacterium]|nr:hypothetical protein [Rhodocyclaceae bacterium]
QSGAIGSGTLATSLAVQVSGSPVLNGTQWTNNGTLDLTGAGTLVFTNGALLTNAAAATLTLGSSAATVFVYGGGAAGHVVNQGALVQQAAGAHAVDANVAFDNQGNVQVAAGTLQLASGADAGSYALASGTTLQYTGGTRTVGSGTSYTGTGSTLLLSGATVNVTNPLSIAQPAVVLSAGSLGGAGSITLSAPFTLSGGAVTGTLTTSGATQISGSPQLAGGNWSNSGVLGIQGSGALVFTNGGHFTNLAAGTVNLNSSAAEPVTYGGGAAGTFDNLGLVTQNAAGAHGMNANVTFNQSATVHVTAGSFVPNNGTDSGATYTLDAGTHVDYTSGT